MAAVDHFPGIKEGKGVQGQGQVTCFICKESFEGVLFKHPFTPIMSVPNEVTKFDVQANVAKYGAKTLVYECNKCHAYVCSNCVPRLKMDWSRKWGWADNQTYGIKGHKYGFPACPSCNQRDLGPFYYIVGRFSKEVVTRKESLGTAANFVYRLKVERPYSSGLTYSIPKGICSLCMSSPADVYHSSQREDLGNKYVTHQIDFPLCNPCLTIINDRVGLEFMGYPLIHHLHEDLLTSSRNKLQVWFVNPNFGELWLKENPDFVPVEFVPIIERM